MFSILIPTLDNLDYLKLCLRSLKENSTYDHEIIIHVNENHEDTIKFLKDENFKYSYTSYNAGICEGVNLAAKLSTKQYILYAHDDFYFCPRWDIVLFNELKNLKHKSFYLSGTMIQNGQVELDCGDNIKNFNEKKLLSQYKNIKYFDFQGSTWAPHLIHKDLWNKVGGFSEEFFPGTGSDPDLNMKLWNEGVRIFKGLQHCKVYHFGSIVSRKKEKKFNTITESGSKGSKLFLVKWGFSIKFFKKYFLKSDTRFTGPLTEPLKNFQFYFDLLICKFHFFYLKIFFKF